MSLYGDIVRGVYEVLGGVSALQTAVVTTRHAPTFLAQIDRFPQVVVAPREDLTERIVEVLFDRQLIIAHEVFVGVYVDARLAADQWEWRLEAREGVREALFRTNALAGQTGTSSVFDVEYDPSPGVRDSAPETVYSSWQKFEYHARVTRYTP